MWEFFLLAYYIFLLGGVVGLLGGYHDAAVGCIASGFPVFRFVELSGVKVVRRHPLRFDPFCWSSKHFRFLRYSALRSLSIPGRGIQYE